MHTYNSQGVRDTEHLGADYFISQPVGLQAQH